MDDRIVLNRRAVAQAEAHAEAHYPIVWYQRRWLTQGIAYLITALLSAYQWRVGFFDVPAGLIALSAICFVVTWVFDVITTGRAFRLALAYQERGLEFPFFERNPFMPDTPTAREAILNVSTAIRAGTLLLAILLPGFGMGISWVAACAALSNQRNAQYVRAQLQAYDALRRQKDTRYPRISRTRSADYPVRW